MLERNKKEKLILILFNSLVTFAITIFHHKSLLIIENKAIF